MNFLNDQFEKTSKDNWTAAAERQLKTLPVSSLSWTPYDNVFLGSYYDKSDLKNLDEQLNFFEGLPAHRWKLYQSVVNNSDENANKRAIAALINGCDGIVFDQKPNEKVLKDIDTAICDIFYKKDDKLCVFNRTEAYSYTYINHHPFDQIQDILSKGNPKICRPAFQDFFTEIAVVRSIRYLLEQQGLSDIHIHTDVPIHENKEFEYFLGTTCAMAAIMGGSHSVALPKIHSQRLSQNIANLIRDESKIGQYTDQIGGSYYIEHLTHLYINQHSNGK